MKAARKRMSAGRFYADVLSRAVEELSDKMPIDFFVLVVYFAFIKYGKKVILNEIN
ncbi:MULTISPECIES: hypothetical protein [Enterococcus]|uniref:Uncharacterized protein n=1 Tax=Enterococcus faecium TaxID=1352 RepID=A0A9X3XUY2_ENTFC|nr:MULTISPECIES: hypothetical protein [Enterococcus]EGP4967912.1 hypothetical protein [Enterococcus faecium]EGP5617064.1 hypothetical protein [Enterococcus faecium]EJC3723467.1 hypothetical protein [Enterococcus faecium]EJY17577.1 hypothetical protein HMPREF1357_02564 [Enterococcus faecium C497]EME8178408.1 hypothetical protein [Enterococcus faecium]